MEQHILFEYSSPWRGAQNRMVGEVSSQSSIYDELLYDGGIEVIFTF